MSGFASEHPGADVRVSPNFGPRVGGQRPSMILLHYTGMESAHAAEERLCDPTSEVSAHYLVHEDGRIVQMVREADRAWHAGASSWKGVSDINSCSIGIEIVNPGHGLGYPGFTEPQMAATIELCRGIRTRHAIACERVLGHSDVAPGRKIDPGEKFDWARLAAHGLGHFVEPYPLTGGKIFKRGDGGRTVQEMQSMLSIFGYGIEISGVYDRQTETVVAAFQRHFRPARIDGRADVSTRRTLRRLLETLPREGSA